METLYHTYFTREVMTASALQFDIGRKHIDDGYAGHLSLKKIRFIIKFAISVVLSLGKLHLGLGWLLWESIHLFCA